MGTVEPLCTAGGNAYAVTATGSLAPTLTPAKPVPGAPTGLAGTLSGSTGTITFGPPSTGGAPDHGAYQVLYKPASAPSYAKGPAVPYCTPGSGSVTDPAGHVWAVTPTGGMTANGKTLVGPAGVFLVLLMPNGSIWQQTTGYEIAGQPNWWSITSPTGSWSGPFATSPLVSPGVALTGLTAPPYDVEVTISNTAGPGRTAGPIVLQPTAGKTRNSLIGFATWDTPYPPTIATILGGSLPDMTGANANIGASPGTGSRPWIQNNGYPSVFGFEIIDGVNAKHWNTAASGGYNAMWNRFIATFAHYPFYAVRIDWEWIGNWFPGGIYAGQQVYGGTTAPSVTPAQFVAAFRNVAACFRQQMPNLKICWDYPCGWLDGTTHVDPMTYYPGDDVVDIVSCDVYFQPSLSPGTSTGNWTTWLSGYNGYNLTTMAAFAKAHNKPMAFPEWGDCFTDGYCIGQFGAWVAAHDAQVVFHIYWDTNNGFGSNPGALLNNAPAKEQAYTAAFGGRTFTGQAFWPAIFPTAPNTAFPEFGR